MVVTLHGGKQRDATGRANKVYVKVLAFTNDGFMYAYYIIKRNYKPMTKKVANMDQ